MSRQGLTQTLRQLGGMLSVAPSPQRLAGMEGGPSARSGVSAGAVE